jgi:hypothetical protein
METESARVLTCVYCGQEYPQDTPAWGSQVLTDHIKVCEKHPMRALEAENARLKTEVILLREKDNSTAASEKSALRVCHLDLSDMDVYVLFGYPVLPSNEAWLVDSHGKLLEKLKFEVKV